MTTQQKTIILWFHSALPKSNPWYAPPVCICTELFNSLYCD